MDGLFMIGAYGYGAESFFTALQQAQIDLFLDLRRRRGMRGRLYSFANASRLQQELEARGIEYRHIIELAPHPDTRELQHQEDVADRTAKRQRVALGDAFVADYVDRTLDTFDWNALVGDLEEFHRPVLFCVERTPEACHRHLVARRLANVTGVAVTNVLP
jgi:uncharacterized protein (DUF488 family)